MTDQRNLVSAVVVFLNEERFLGEAVESVLGQTYDNWELVLADDGSADGSTALAKEYARRQPARIRYTEHPGHANRGASATRNLGVAAARGEWIAFLDGDDVWLPARLERSVALARDNPRANMVYGKTEYWHSWSGPDATRNDWLQPHFFPADQLVTAPDLLIRHLTLRAAVPCMGSLLVRRRAFLEVGGFDESFRGLVDDAVFLARFLLKHDVYVSNECWDRYRQHPGSDTAMADAEGRMRNAHGGYLKWLQAFIADNGITDRRLDRALRDAIRRVEASPGALQNRVERAIRRVTRWASGH
jgi:glycosyltransferase involved in cell wall biosynthesis